MVLSGLVSSFFRLASHIRSSAFTSCIKPEEVAVMDEKVDIQGEDPVFLAALERQSHGDAQVSSHGFSGPRIGSSKRKLEELDVEGAADSHRPAMVQWRCRRQATVDERECIGREGVNTRSINVVSPQYSNGDSHFISKEGNVADVLNLMADGLQDIEYMINVLSSDDAGVVKSLSDEGGMHDESFCAGERKPQSTKNDLTVSSCSVKSEELSDSGNLSAYNDFGTGDSEIIIEIAESLKERESDLGQYGNSEMEFFDRDGVVSCKMRNQAKDSGAVMEASGNPDYKGAITACGNRDGTRLHARNSSCKEDLACSDAGRCSHAGIQFFVRTYINGRTIVLYANQFDTIAYIQLKIFLKTCIPMPEQRLIYAGRQLQEGQTLVQCQIVNDTTIFMVARLRSTDIPLSWQRINDVVAIVRQVYDSNSVGGPSRLELMQAEYRIKSGVEDFLKMATESASFPKHMEVFQLSGATSALIILLTSGIQSSRICAQGLITIFLSSNEDFLPANVYSHCAPVLLDFCKLLAKCAPEDPLYSFCRSALARLLDKVGVAHGSMYFNEARPETIVQDFAPFVSELASCLSSSLRQASKSSIIFKEGSGVFVEGQDFNAFVLPFCKAMEACDDLNPSSSFSGIDERCISCIFSADEVDLCRDPTKLTNVDVLLNVVEKFGSEKWLGKHFVDLVLDLDSCLAVQLSPDEGAYGWAPYLVVLKGLHSIAKLCKGAMEVLLRMLQIRRSALNLLVKQSHWQDDYSWLLDHKNLLDFETKQKLVMVMLPEPQEDNDERHEVLVHRSQLLHESFDVLAYADPDALQGGISMEFHSEEATGPGVLREWFFLICREIFNPQKALFLSCPNDRRRIFPNPASGVNPGHLTYFRFCGRVIALALMHRVQIDIVLASAFFKQLAGIPVSWEDSRDADPVLFESCRKILELDAEVVDSDALGLSFVCDEENLGMVRTVELCPGGEDLSVNSKNRLDFVELLVQQRFVTCVKEQVSSFSQGFSDILVKGSLALFLKGLDAGDLDLMLHGSGHSVCVEDWKAHTEYHDYCSFDAPIIWFWQVVEAMTTEQRRKLLFFATSVTHLPIEGFAGLPSKFHIHKAETDVKWLPTAHTCFYQLVLPPYPSIEVMQARLLALTQVHLNEGFGFA